MSGPSLAPTERSALLQIERRGRGASEKNPADAPMKCPSEGSMRRLSVSPGSLHAFLEIGDP